MENNQICKYELNARKNYFLIYFSDIVLIRIYLYFTD